MVTREDIKAEAAFIQHLIESTNPTGTAHTPTPWKAKDGAGSNYQIFAPDRWIATFDDKCDRDLALYFVNAHAGMLAVMRSDASAFGFIARATADAGLRDLAFHKEELASVYTNGFASMGATFAQGKAPDPTPEHAYPSHHDPRAPDAEPSLIAAFGVMDLLKPGVISHEARVYLAGCIEGLIDRAYRQGRDGKPLHFPKDGADP
jgi:hypothetical protein